jgi:hypothetical protein
VDPDNPDTIYVPSTVSTDASANAADAGEDTGTDYPNWTHDYKHGKTFEMTVEKLSYAKVGTGSTFDGIDDVGAGSTAPVIQNV